MLTLKNIIMIVIIAVISIAMTPVVWEAIYTDNLGTCTTNSSASQIDCQTGATGLVTKASFCVEGSSGKGCVIGTAKTILQLVPFIYVGAIIIGGTLVGWYKSKE